MSNPYARERYRTAVETLARYRSAAERAVWAVGLAFVAAAVIVPLLGSRFLTALILSAGIIAVFAHWDRAAERVQELKPLPCLDDDCYEEGGETLAVTYISNQWICGFCDKTHPPFECSIWGWWRSTLVDPCENRTCKQLQHSVICWRCRKPIIWNEEAYSRAPKNSAWLPGYPALELPPEQPPPVAEDRPPRIIDEDLR
jgi:hypothetical protein